MSEKTDELKEEKSAPCVSIFSQRSATHIHFNLPKHGINGHSVDQQKATNNAASGGKGVQKCLLAHSSIPF